MVITALVILVSSLKKTPADEQQILHVHKIEWITLKIKTCSIERKNKGLCQLEQWVFM
jgi:hypothetical protein